MTYSAARGRVVLSGGEIPGGTWEYRWTSDWPDEICTSGDDDDADGLTDCSDPDCDGKPCGGGVCSEGVCQ